MSTRAQKHSTSTAHDSAFNTFLSRNQLAARWQVSKETLKRRERAGVLKPCRLNARTIRYRLSDVLRIEEEAQAEVGRNHTPCLNEKGRASLHPPGHQLESLIT